MSNRREPCLLITCEHGGNDVPEDLGPYFASPEAGRHLRSHRGYDPGALFAAQSVAGLLGAPIQYSTISRLVVELNRSLDSPQLFSKFLVDEDDDTKQQILDLYYHPYRQRVSDSIRQRVDAGQSVVHLSIHTFTPRFRGSARKFDIGVLFDPQRVWENRFCTRLVTHLATCSYQVLPNQPYLGIDDGLTTTLRIQFGDTLYAGIELELNNRIHRLSETSKVKWCTQIAGAIRRCIKG